MEQLNMTFDAERAEEEKENGMNQAATKRKWLLEKCREWAIEIAESNNGLCHSDLVSRRMIAEGYTPEQLGNAAGSVFRGKSWRFTGEWVVSERVSHHGGLLRVWKRID